MHQSSCSTWSVIMTFTMLVLLFPNIFCHLGSALRAGSGTLTKFTLGDSVIYCTFTNLGEGKPPVLSHVRVSREPQPRHLFKNDFDSGGIIPVQTSSIKSPSYQHKILQFHSTGQSGNEYYPTKHLVSQYQPASKSLPVYPVASKFANLDTRKVIGHTSVGSFPDDDNDDGSWEVSNSHRWEPNLLPEPDEPTFTPYIGARALTNIPKFFEHLRENIEALYDKGRDSSSEELTSEEGQQEDNDKSQEAEDIEKIATPTRRGYSSQSEPRLSQGVHHDDEGDSTFQHSRPFALESKQYPRQSRADNSEPDKRTKELYRFLRRSPEYPRANGFNPSWLFTNLGLGKRSEA